MPFAWTELNTDTDELLVECGLGNICDDTDPDYDDNIQEVGVMMHAAYAFNFKRVIAYMVDALDLDEPIPSMAIEWIDQETHMAYDKAIFYYDIANMNKLHKLLGYALQDFAEELALEPNEDNVNSFDFPSNPGPQKDSTSVIKE